MSKSIERDLKTYWNKRASSYPRYKEGDEEHEAEILRLIKDHGIDFKGMSILDLGCGSGKYTIRLAQEAEKISALDISDEMLRISKKDSGRLGIDNITYINSDWLDFKSDEKFDLIFCSMTPALRSLEGRNKVKEYARQWIVYTGFVRRSHSPLMLRLYEIYAQEPREFNSALKMREWLEAQGLDYARYPVKGDWQSIHSHDEMLSICMANVYNFGGSPDEAKVEKVLENFRRPSGDYLECTGYEIDLLIWQQK